MELKAGNILIALSIAMMILFAGMYWHQKKMETPSFPVRTDTVLRDPFRPDHPTRSEWEAEKRQKKNEIQK